MSEVTSAQLEDQLDAYRKQADKGERLQRLLSNHDFKAIILEHFCVQDAARYVQESCDPALDASQRADALAMAQAPGHLKRWLWAQEQMSSAYKKAIPEVEEALAEARAEESAD